MSQFQAQAALLRQMQLDRGGKNQVRNTDTTPQIVQPSMAQAPAAGALAPLVMPVPDYESANTLQQAIAAVNSFGNVVAQAGNYVRSENNDIKQSAQESKRAAAEQTLEVQKQQMLPLKHGKPVWKDQSLIQILTQIYLLKPKTRLLQ